MPDGRGASSICPHGHDVTASPCGWCERDAATGPPSDGMTLDEWDDLRARIDRLVAELDALPGCRATLALRVDVRITVTADD